MKKIVYLAGFFALQAYGAVHISSLRPSAPSPQTIGNTITWRVRATDSHTGPLTFQFNVAPPRGSFAMVKDFNVGVLRSGTWSAQPFVWALTGIEGIYQVQVVIKDFKTGQTDTKTAQFRVEPLVTGSSPVVVKTSQPLVALFSAPSCARGSSMRVSFQQQSGSTPSMMTSWLPCHPPDTMTFEVAGMYPTTDYNMFSQTMTGTNITNGPTVSFTTGAIPSNVPFATFKVLVPPGPNTDTADSILFSSIAAHGTKRNPPPPDGATDLTGHPMWYYGLNSSSNLIRRPLAGGTFLSTEGGLSWQKRSKQLLRQVDLEGNIIRETNTGIIQQELLAMGATDGGPCGAIPRPAAVGAACLGSFHHDDIQTLPNGYTAALVDIEKIFPPGTQGDTSGLPVDIIGDMILVLDTNWQVKWYFETFQHDSGAPQLDITRPAVLGETCVVGQGGCPTIYLLGKGIAPKAHDWLHANSIYYWPQTHDLIWSSRHQDWVMKVDYNDGAGTGNILWRMGKDGDFTFNNINNDPYPWFSHQHEVGIEDKGNGVMTIFDNGNTRVAPAPIGLGHGCGPNDCYSRGMALNVDEAGMTVTPALSVDLGVLSGGDGSAQLLANGNYYFMAGFVIVGANNIVGHAFEIFPTAGTTNGTVVLHLQGPLSYRGWQLPDLYNPPIT